MASSTVLMTSEDLPTPRDRSGPVWQRIDRDLSVEISSGRWQPGERLPTEQDLAVRFEVNRHTIRRAIQSMVQRGLLKVEQGRGTFVQGGAIDYHVSRHTRYEENIIRSRREPAGITLSVADILPPVSVARHLKIHPRSPVVAVERLNMAGEMPVGLSTVYLPVGRFAGFGHVFAQCETFAEAFKHFGIEEYTRVSTKVMARMPTAEEAKLLQQPANRPILQTEAVEIDEEGKPIAVALTRFASERVHLMFEGAELTD